MSWYCEAEHGCGGNVAIGGAGAVRDRGRYCGPPPTGVCLADERAIARNVPPDGTRTTVRSAGCIAGAAGAARGILVRFRTGGVPDRRGHGHAGTRLVVSDLSGLDGPD